MVTHHNEFATPAHLSNAFINIATFFIQSLSYPIFNVYSYIS
jgi:hypothetical protein